MGRNAVDSLFALSCSICISVDDLLYLSSVLVATHNWCAHWASSSISSNWRDNWWYRWCPLLPWLNRNWLRAWHFWLLRVWTIFTNKLVLFQQLFGLWNFAIGTSNGMHCTSCGMGIQFGHSHQIAAVGARELLLAGWFALRFQFFFRLGKK